jgi:hypothetical protein
MGKRGNGEGSITRRKDGLYMARYTVETATGAKRKTLYAKTRKEAAEKLTAAMADASKGITPDGGARQRPQKHLRPERIPLSGSPDTRVGSKEAQDPKCGGCCGLLPLPARLRV